MKLFTKALVVTLVVSCHLSLAGATVIEEITVDSVNTRFELLPSPGVLTIAQTGVDLTIERSDDTQQTITDVDFILLTPLVADNSIGGQAIADFAGGTITITDATGVLLTADINAFSVEESLSLPFTVISGSGDFTVVTENLLGEFGPNGVIFDITWKLSKNIDSFVGSDGFTAESNVTLTPEPATMILLGTGALFAVKRRRRC